MLQSIRNKASSWFALAILFLALFALTFFGIGDYFTTRVDTHVAMVGNSKIEQNDYQQRYQNWRAGMAQRLGDNFDPAMLDQPMWRQQILDEMITETVLKNANERMNMVVAPSQLQSIILAEPTFHLAGQFDAETYRVWLAQQRMTPSMLEQRLRDQLGARLLPTGVASSSTVTDSELDAYLHLSEQTRDARFVRVTGTDEAISEEITDEELQKYYDDHSSQFMSEETVTVEYVEVDAKALETDIEPSESELQERYEQEKARFSTPEQRQAAQILVRPADDSDEARAAALAKATGLVEQARAEGADFAALARENSDDLGSRAQGGDLGWLEKGLTDPAFDEALFALDAAGAVSDPVRTEEGYHVIALRELRPGTEKPFEEVRGQLRDETLQRERERIFSEKAGRLADALYADPDAMATVVAGEGLEVKTAGPFGRNASQGVFATPGVRRAAFSSRVLTEGDVSESIEIGPNHVVLLRVVEHKPAEPRPLADVTEVIRGRILAQRLGDAVKARAEALLARVEAGESLADVTASLGEDVEVETAEGITRASATPEQSLVAQIFRLPRPDADGTPVRRLLEIGGGHAITELSAVRDGDPATIEQARRDQVREQLQQSRASAEQAALVAALRRGEKIEISNTQQNTLDQ